MPQDVSSINANALDRFLDWWLITFGSVDRSRDNTSFASNSGFATITVQFKQFADVEFGLLQYLHFANVDIMKGIDTLASLFDILADGLDLSVLGIACFPLRVLILVGESNAENPQEVTITGLDINASFNQRLPFLDH